MTPPEEVKLKLVADWRRKAEADLGLAEHLASEGVAFPGAIAFHCQQAAEKYVKAFLVWCEIDFPKTHDLEELLDLVESANRSLASHLRDAIVLTPYGVEQRYPGDRPETSPPEACEAVRLAGMVRDAIVPLLPKMPHEQQ
jgi:HEPN domain-containing protein